MRKPVNIDSQEDADWISGLIDRMVEREQTRLKGDKVFSPSALASCLRQVYLLKHAADLEIKTVKSTRVESNFYFLNGNFLHLKWQFALYKMDKVLDDDDFKLIDVEYRVISKHGDHGGTSDVLCLVDYEPTIIDFKGWNTRWFGQLTRGEPFDAFHEARMQMTDYMMLYNSQKDRPTKKIKRGFLIVENKGGPDNMHPLALHETEIDLASNLPEVRGRLEALRKHGKENSLPPPECESTRSLQFQGCPFQKFCKPEVKEIERRKSDGSNPSKYRVAVSKGRGANSSRRNSK